MVAPLRSPVLSARETYLLGSFPLSPGLNRTQEHSQGNRENLPPVRRRCSSALVSLPAEQPLGIQEKK